VNPIQILNTFGRDTYKVDALRLIDTRNIDPIKILNMIGSDTYKVDALRLINIGNVDPIKLLNMIKSDTYKVDCCQIIKNNIIRNVSNKDFIDNLLNCFSKKDSKRTIINMFNIKGYSTDELDGDDSDVVFASEINLGSVRMTGVTMTGGVRINGFNVSDMIRENQRLKNAIAHPPHPKPKLVVPECTDNETENDSLQCCLCFTNENKIVLNCGHQFCRSCIVIQTSTKKECPICRQEIVMAIRIFNTAQ